MSVRLLKRLEQSARFLENTSLVLLLLAMIVLASTQILLRNVFDSGLVWADELLRILVLWLGLLGAVVASREDRQIKIDVLTRFLSEKSQRVATFVTHLFTALVCAIVAWHAWIFVKGSIEFEETVLGGAPAWIFQIILPLGFGLIAYRYLLYAFAQLVGPSKDQS